MNTVFKESILWCSIIATSLIFGVCYGLGNQNTYLISGLTLINSDFLLGDWFAHNTSHIHHNFSYILLFLNSIGLTVFTGTILIEIILRIIGILAIYKTIVLISNKKVLSVFLIILSIIVFEKTDSIAVSYIFSSYLQPSSFGSMFFLVCLYNFIRGNYFLSGLMLTIAGLMHLNYLILGFLVFGIAHLFLGFKDIVKRLFQQFSIMLIALLFEIPYLLELMMSDNGEKANYIFQQIRSPHHYVLGSDNLYMLYHFVGWLILGFIGLKLLDIKVNLRTRLLGIYSGLFIPILIAVFFTSVIFVPFISKIFFFRLAPFSTLFAQILFVGGIFSGTVFKAKNTIIQKLCLITLIFIGSLLILQWYILRYGLFSSYSLFFTGIMLTLVIVSVENVKIKYIKNNFLNYLIGFLSIFLLIISLFFQFKHFSYVSFFYNNIPTIQERSLYNWVKNSDPTSKFLIPPGLGNFRLNAERAIIVDWKSTPYLPDELIEWYERIQDVSGEKNITSYLDVKKGYLNLDLQRLKFLKEKYSITHAVLLESQNSIKHNLPVIFNNEKYHVIDLQSLD